MSTSTPSGRWRTAGWWIATVAWMGIIFWLSSQPDSDPGGTRLNIGVYKLAHLIVFSVLGVLVAGATRHSNTPRAAWWAWVLVVLYAISDEIHQSFVPGRTPLVTDVAIDSLGGLVGIFGYMKSGDIREGRVWPLSLLLGRQPPPAHAGAIDPEGSAEERR
jgi:VanZ family protein